MVTGSRRVGITAILLALLLRLTALGIWDRAAAFLHRPDTTAFLIYTETGRKVRFSSSEIPVTRYGVVDFPRESRPPQPPRPPVFRDPGLTELTYLCPYRPDLGKLLEKPLSWELRTGAPTVLIYHTHTTESYAQGDPPYAETAPYRTADPAFNMLAIGDRVSEILEQAGIVTLHDRSFHDYPAYNGCYGRSRDTVRQYLKDYPGLKLILDLHRDACDSGSGQLRTHAEVKGRDSAQLMIVAGTDAAGLPHKHWQENLSLGLKLQAQLETASPGIVRPLSLRSQRFNQDLSPGALLIEVGGAGNTREEALVAGEMLAKAILALAGGTSPPEG